MLFENFSKVIANMDFKYDIFKLEKYQIYPSTMRKRIKFTFCYIYGLKISSMLYKWIKYTLPSLCLVVIAHYILSNKHTNIVLILKSLESKGGDGKNSGGNCGISGGGRRRSEGEG